MLCLTLQKWKAALKSWYSAPLEKVFARFRAGLIYFTVGLMVIYLANSALEPSLTQDLIALAGLTLAAVGFVIAILAHMRMLISRFHHFINKK